MSFRSKDLYVKKSKFSQEQIVRILKEVEAGAKVAETCRKRRISEPTYYAWKAKYAGMDISQLRRLKELESEKANLKKMYAELALVHHALQGFVSKKALSQDQRTELCLASRNTEGVSQRAACSALRSSRSAPYYRCRRADDTPVIEAVGAYVVENPGHGFGLLAGSFHARACLAARRVCGASTAS